jgi:uncharacterized protein (TIGR02265 family)
VFTVPDWSAAVNFETRLAAIPQHAKARGMFFQFLIQAMGTTAPPEAASRRYVAFKNYPVREYVELIMLGCASRPVRVSPAEYVRRLGRRVYPNYAKTMTGTAIFAVAGHNYRRVVELCPAAYRVGMEPGTITVRSISDGHAVVELRELYNLPDLHQVGIWEGAMDVCKVKGEIKVNKIDFGSVDFEIDWQVL